MSRHLGLPATALVALFASAASAAWVVRGTGVLTGQAEPPPAVATGVTVTAASCGLTSVTVTLTWNPVPGATGYTVDRTNLGSTKTVAQVSATSTVDTYTVGSLPAYTVTSWKGSWRSLTPSSSTPGPSHC